MEAKQIFELMDYFWFERQIFRKKHEPPAEFMHRKEDEASGEKSKPKVQNLRIRSYSDRCIGVDFDADSPRSVIITKQKLQKIEEVIFEHCFAGREKPRRKKEYGGRRERGMSRSLSALEFEELKGFMDLGFEFNEEETNPSITSIVPGLQKWKRTAAADGGEEEVGVSRPYLSEAWGDLSRRRDIVMNLRIPYGKNEMDMKHHLKVWAHVVASTVR